MCFYRYQRVNQTSLSPPHHHHRRRCENDSKNKAFERNLSSLRYSKDRSTEKMMTFERRQDSIFDPNDDHSEDTKRGDETRWDEGRALYVVRFSFTWCVTFTNEKKLGLVNPIDQSIMISSFALFNVDCMSRISSMLISSSLVSSRLVSLFCCDWVFIDRIPNSKQIVLRKFFFLVFFSQSHKSTSMLINKKKNEGKNNRK